MSHDTSLRAPLTLRVLISRGGAIGCELIAIFEVGYDLGVGCLTPCEDDADEHAASITRAISSRKDVASSTKLYLQSALKVHFDRFYLGGKSRIINNIAKKIAKDIAGYSGAPIIEISEFVHQTGETLRHS